MRQSCRTCKGPLSAENAVRRRRAPDGYDDVCRPCEAARVRASYLRHRDAKSLRNRLAYLARKERRA